MERIFTYLWRNKWITARAETIDDMIAMLEAGAAELREWRDAGVTLEGGAEDDYAMLRTTDPAVAAKYHFEEEIFEDEDDEGFDDGIYGHRNGHGDE